MNISYSHLNRLSRWEVFQLLYDILDFVEQETQDRPEKFTEKLVELRTAFDIYDIEIVQERNFTSPLLLEAERARNYALRKMYSLILYYSDYEFDENMEKAANMLLPIFKFYGTARKISKMAQDAKTGVLTILLQVLEKPENKLHIEILKLEAPLLSLIENNDIFAKEHTLRLKQQIHYVKGAAKDARINAQTQFIEFVDVVNALAVVEGPEKYDDLKIKVSAFVKKYVAQAKLRVKRKRVKE